MSKDDFRDRLKSYSEIPDPGEWSKMEQLLDADKDDSKIGFAWWRVGTGVLLLGLFSIVAWQFMAETSVEVAVKNELIVVDGRVKTKDLDKARGVLEPRAGNRESGFDGDVDKDERLIQDERRKMKDIVEPRARSRELRFDGDVDKDERRKTKDIVEPRAGSRESGFGGDVDKDERLKTKDVLESRAGSRELRFDGDVNEDKKLKTKENTVVRQFAEVEDTRKDEKLDQDERRRTEDERLIAEVKIADVNMEDGQVDELIVIQGPAIFKERDVLETEEIIAVGDNRIETKDKGLNTKDIGDESVVVVTDNSIMRPWFVVSEVGVKFPTVDIQNPEPGALVPAQEFFPSYTAGLGMGRSFGKFSVELGLTASLYQFKLGEVIDQTKIDMLNSPNVLEGTVPVISSNEQFVINKFAIASPYLRTQYSMPLKKNFLLGLHASVLANSIINLPNQFESGQFATTNDLGDEDVFDFDRIQSAASQSDEGIRSMNFDLGLSIEKILGNRGRLAFDLSYTLATGYLEQGSYTALRNSEFQSKGTYQISGVGPVARLRYYLHFGKQS